MGERDGPSGNATFRHICQNLLFVRCGIIHTAMQQSCCCCPSWAFPPLTWGRLCKRAASFLFRGIFPRLHFPEVAFARTGATLVIITYLQHIQIYAPSPLATSADPGHIPVVRRAALHRCPSWAFPPLTWGRLCKRAASFLFRGSFSAVRSFHSAARLSCRDASATSMIACITSRRSFCSFVKPAVRPSVASSR